MARYRHAASFIGVGGFPIDMLRYDGCTPYHERDASLIANSFSHQREEATIWVEALTSSKVSPFTHDRWLSFGWELREVGITERVS